MKPENITPYVNEIGQRLIETEQFLAAIRKVPLADDRPDTLIGAYRRTLRIQLDLLEQQFREVRRVYNEVGIIIAEIRDLRPPRETRRFLMKDGALVEVSPEEAAGAEGKTVEQMIADEQAVI